jgi:ketosteroid isomerase-like protein
MAFYADDAVQMPAHGPMLEGRDAIRAWILSWLAEPGVSNAFAAETVEVAACGDMAYERGTYRSSRETPEGSTHDVGTYLTVWKKIEGMWYATVDIANSDLPLPEPEEPSSDTKGS